MRKLVLSLVFYILGNLCLATERDTAGFHSSLTYFRNEIKFIEFASIEPEYTGYARIKMEGELWKKKRRIGYQSSIFSQDSTNLSRLQERTFASDSSRRALENILFKLPFEERSSQASCYEPRNAILFYDQDKKLLGIMEICFQCKGILYSPGFKLRFELSAWQFDSLKSLFASVGIKYGTT